MTTESSGNSGVDTAGNCEMLVTNATPHVPLKRDCVETRAPSSELQRARTDVTTAKNGIFSRRSARLWVVLALAVTGVYSICCSRPEWMNRIGIGNMGVWFLDTRGALAAGDAYAQGLAPNGLNPFDTFRLPPIYPSWWSVLHAWGVTRADYAWMGALWGFAFLVAALAQLRARSLAELFWSVLVCCSPPVLFAFGRGNADLVIVIVLSALIPLLLSRIAFVRWIAPLLILLATGMKIYPAAVALLLLWPNRPRRETAAQLILMAVLLLAFFASEAGSLARYRGIPRPDGLFTYGASIAPDALGIPHGLGVCIALVFATISIGFWWRRAAAIEISPEHQPEYLRFILGAAVFTSCYFATVNYTYRLVCTIWMASYLWRAATEGNAPESSRRLAQVSSALLFVVLWIDGVACFVLNSPPALSAHATDAITDRVRLAEQPIVAALIFALLGYLVPFARRGLRGLTADPVPPIRRTDAGRLPNLG